jgi:hypothetical protein
LHRSSDENDRMNKSVATKTTNLSSIRATVYTVADLQVATESFSADSLIGEGAFGRVYRGQFSDQKVYSSLCQNEKHTYFFGMESRKSTDIPAPPQRLCSHKNTDSLVLQKV